jgi:hypothetical protein
MASRFLVRPAEEDDPASIAALLAAVRDYYPARFVHGFDIGAEEVARLMQTGHSFLLAEREGRLVGAVRHRQEDGIAWFDLLASAEAGAGRALVAAVERLGQDRGLRLVRTRIPDVEIVEAYLGRRGYVGISREQGDDGEPALVVEKRLPLLTVREQRRADAEAIGALTGEDPWPFEQMARPGWFVASDGERVVGAIGVSGGGGGVARMSVPVLVEDTRDGGWNRGWWTGRPITRRRTATTRRSCRSLPRRDRWSGRWRTGSGFRRESVRAAVRGAGAGGGGEVTGDGSYHGLHTRRMATARRTVSLTQPSWTT